MALSAPTEYFGLPEATPILDACKSLLLCMSCFELFFCKLQMDERKRKRGKTNALKGTPSIARVQPPLELGGLQEPVTPANPITDLSTESDDEDGDLVSFNGKMHPCGQLSNTLAHSKLHQNIAPVIRKRKQSVLSSESSESEYSSDRRTSITVCSPEDAVTC